MRKKLRQTQTGKHNAKVNDDLNNCRASREGLRNSQMEGKEGCMKTKCYVEFRTVF